MLYAKASKQDFLFSFEFQKLPSSGASLFLEAQMQVIEHNGAYHKLEYTLDLSQLVSAKYKAVIHRQDTLPPFNQFEFDVEIEPSGKVWINAMPSLLPLTSVKESEWIRPDLLRVTGYIQNIGAMSWNRGFGLGAIKVGAILTSQSGATRELVSEYRYEMPSEVVLPGDGFQYTLLMSASDFSTLDYTLSIDLVKEGEFWFESIAKNTSVHLPIKKLLQKQGVVKSEKPISQREKGSFKKIEKIIWICPTLPEFDRSTGGVRLLAILEAQRQYVDSIIFLSESISDRNEILRGRLNELGIECYSNPMGYLAENPQDPSVQIIIGWYDCAHRNIATIKSLQPENQIIIDTVDLNWVRESRGVSLGLLNYDEQTLEQRKLVELEVYQKADEVWVVSEAERLLLWTEVPDIICKVIQVPIIKQKNNQYLNESIDPPEVVFVGGFNHPPNESGALWANEICTFVRQILGKPVRLNIIGANPPESIQALHNGTDTFVLGFQEDLSIWYQRASVALITLHYGAGVKGKLLEALAFDVPVISTTVGIEGLEFAHSLHASVADTTESLANLLVEKLEDNKSAIRQANESFKELDTFIGKAALSNVIKHTLTVPHVVIAIVTFNKLALLQKCLQSVLKLTKYPTYQLAVWSNGCVDGTVEYLKELQKQYPDKLLLHFSNENEFFIRPNNKIIEAYPESDILLLNNDTEILDPFWLSALVDAAYSSTVIACAGGLCLGIDGNILEAGAEIYPNGHGVNLLRGKAASDPTARQFKFPGYVSGCLMYMRRDVIEKIGLLNEDLFPMYYEDCDWQFRAKRFGLKTIFSPFAKIIHKEGSSAGKDTTKGPKAFQEVNRMKFLSLFKDIL